MNIRPFQPEDEEAVIALWRKCGLVRPWNDPHKDIQRKQAVRPEWFLVGELEGRVVACVMAGYEGHRGWLNYLAVAPEHQRHGLARALVTAAERLLQAAGCPKINLQVRTSNSGVIEFYRRLGYAVDDVVSLGKRLERDDHSETEKTLAEAAKIRAQCVREVSLEEILKWTEEAH
jgi:ribosomal protein S18 acetylase RimI-like enzyme